MPPDLYVDLVSKDVAYAVLSDPLLYERAIDDRCPKDPREGIALMPSKYYHGLYVDEHLAGVNFFHLYEDGAKIHFQMLKEYRKYSRELLELSLDRLLVPIYCEIPECYPEVINFAKNSGFKEVGVSFGSFIKGEPLDRVIFKRD